MGRFFYLAFPNDGDDPLVSPKSTNRGAISSHILLELVQPELTIRLGYRGSLAADVTVPEAAVDKHRPSAQSVREIGRTRQISVVDAVSETERVCDASHRQFCCGAVLPDATKSRRGRWIGVELLASRRHASDYRANLIARDAREMTFQRGNEAVGKSERGNLRPRQESCSRLRRERLWFVRQEVRQ